MPFRKHFKELICIMIPIVLTVVTIVIPFVSLLVLSMEGKKRGVRIENYILALLITTFAYFCGGWLYSSVYLKYLLAFVFLLTTIFYFKKRKKMAAALASNAKNWNRKRYYGLVWKVPLIAGFTFLCYIYFSSRTYPEPSVDIQFPFKNGDYIIMQGGGNKYMNIIHSENTYAILAFDIVKLNSFGGRARTVFSKDNRQYEIFGEKLYAPIGGKVVAMKRDMPDNVPPDANQDEKAGNHIVIQNGNTFVMLAHLRQRTIAVKQNELVKAGDYIGDAGNSGNSLEPHLHIEARQTIDGVTTPSAIKFDGGIYTYNDLIKK